MNQIKWACLDCFYLQESSFLWYSIAMFYKFSSLPMFVSIVYVCAIAKNWPFVYGIL